MTLAYNTGDGGGRDIFSDVNIRLSIKNVTDQDPPFFYDPVLTQGTAGAMDQNQFAEFGRPCHCRLTKLW